MVSLSQIEQSSPVLNPLITITNDNDNDVDFRHAQKCGDISTYEQRFEYKNDFHLIREFSTDVITSNVPNFENLTGDVHSWREIDNGLVPCHISHREPKITIFAGMTQIYIPQTAGGSGGGLRNSITKFSRGARKRMIELLAKMRNPEHGSFITLTYPSTYPDSAQQWKRHLDTFLKRLKRAAPKSYGVWRIEPQERGAPHFHLIVFNAPRNILRFRQWTKLAWYQVVGSGDEKHLRAGCRIDVIHSQRHAMNYASKYAAKASDARRFITNEGEIIDAVGKHWGQFGMEHADISSYHEQVIDFAQLVELRRMIARLLKSRGSKYHRRIARAYHKLGFTVFGVGDSAQKWKSGQQITIMKMLLWLLNS